MYEAPRGNGMESILDGMQVLYRREIQACNKVTQEENDEEHTSNDDNGITGSRSMTLNTVIVIAVLTVVITISITYLLEWFSDRQDYYKAMKIRLLEKDIKELADNDKTLHWELKELKKQVEKLMHV